jgi:membrane protein
MTLWAHAACGKGRLNFLYSHFLTLSFSSSHWSFVVERQPVWYKRIFTLAADAVFAFFGSDAFVHASALAYYTIFSIAPLLLFIALAGTVNNAEQIQYHIMVSVEKQAGAAPAMFVRDIMVNSTSAVSSGLATGIDILFLIYGASSVFHQLQNSLNAMWNLTPRGETITRSVLYVATMRLISALIVIVLGLMLIVLVIANTIESALAFKPIEWLSKTLDVPPTYWRWVIAPLTYLLVFILMFKFLPKAAIRWRDVLPGAVVTSLLLLIGNRLIDLYLSYIFEISIYGAAGSVFVFLIWIYYLALIVLFGAKFTLLYAERFGQAITPDASVMVMKV